MRFGLLVLLAGCSFRDGVRPQGDAGSGAPDAPPDAMKLPACTAMLAGGPSIAGRLGSNSSTTLDLVCPPGELPVGFRFVTSNAEFDDGQKAVLRTRLLCGRVQRDAMGMATTTLTTSVDSNQNGTCIITATTGPDRFCPSGMLLVGVSGNTPGNQDYNSVVLHCRPLDGAAVVQVTATDTGSYTGNPQSALCSSNEIVASVSTRASCTQETLLVRCSAFTCQ